MAVKNKGTGDAVLNEDGSVTHPDTDEGREAADKLAAKMADERDQAAADLAAEQGEQARALAAQLQEAGLDAREKADGTMARERGSEV